MYPNLHQNMDMRNFIKKNLISIVLSVAGATGGFLYWKYVGCLSGTCIIKSTWYLSTLYGMVFGYVIGSLAEDLIGKFKKREKI